MTAAGKIQRAPRVRDGKKGGKRRLDGKAPSQNAEIPCAYAKCVRTFAPAKHNQRYCSDGCRKRASFDRKFLRLEDDPHRVLQCGDQVLVRGKIDFISSERVEIKVSERGPNVYVWTACRGSCKQMPANVVIPAKEK